MSVDITDITSLVETRDGLADALSGAKIAAVLDSLERRIAELEKKTRGSDRAESDWSRQAPLESRVGPDRIHAGRTDGHP